MKPEQPDIDNLRKKEKEEKPVIFDEPIYDEHFNKKPKTIKEEF